VGGMTDERNSQIAGNGSCVGPGGARVKRRKALLVSNHPRDNPPIRNQRSTISNHQSNEPRTLDLTAELAMRTTLRNALRNVSGSGIPSPAPACLAEAVAARRRASGRVARARLQASPGFHGWRSACSRFPPASGSESGSGSIAARRPSGLPGPNPISLLSIPIPIPTPIPVG
jgi:hypothetical protein